MSIFSAFLRNTLALSFVSAYLATGAAGCDQATGSKASTQRSASGSQTSALVPATPPRVVPSPPDSVDDVNGDGSYLVGEWSSDESQPWAVIAFIHGSTNSISVMLRVPRENERTTAGYLHVLLDGKEPPREGSLWDIHAADGHDDITVYNSHQVFREGDRPVPSWLYAMNPPIKDVRFRVGEDTSTRISGQPAAQVLHALQSAYVWAQHTRPAVSTASARLQQAKRDAEHRSLWGETAGESTGGPLGTD